MSQTANINCTNYSNFSSSQRVDPAKLRILQKNIVYVIGLSATLANENILRQHDFFGQYGEITKIVVNKNGYNQSNHNETTYSSYVSYKTKEQASLALLAIDSIIIDGNLIRCSFGTTKYCSYFLKGVQCFNRECLYLHQWADENDVIVKENGDNKTIFMHQQKIARKILGINYSNNSNNYNNNRENKTKTIKFPSPERIFKANLNHLKYFSNCYSALTNMNNNNFDNIIINKKNYHRKRSDANSKSTNSQSDSFYCSGQKKSFDFTNSNNFNKNLYDYNNNSEFINYLESNNNNNEEEEEDEYILVKETKKKNKKYRNFYLEKNNLDYIHLRKLRQRIQPYVENRQNKDILKTTKTYEETNIDNQKEHNISSDTNGSSNGSPSRNLSNSLNNSNTTTPSSTPSINKITIPIMTNVINSNSMNSKQGEKAKESESLSPDEKIPSNNQNIKSNSNDTNSSINNNNNNNTEFKMFESSNTSRFGFAQNRSREEEEVNVPEYIQELLSSKLSFLAYMKNIDNNNFYEGLLMDNESTIWNWDNF